MDGLDADQTDQADQNDPADVERQDLATRLWARAHHEAAHAVVGTLLGGQVEAVEIWSGPPVAGMVRLAGLNENGSAGEDSYGLVRRIVYALAGPIAERIASGGAGMIANEPASQVATLLLEAVRDPSSTGREADIGAVAGLMQGHFGPHGEVDLAAAVDHLPLHVETLLRDRWSAVEVIAVSLLRHGRLTDDQFRALFADALPGVEMAALLDPSSA